MSVYIIHSSVRVGSPRHSAQHYVGFTKRKITIRHKEHLVNQDVPLINAFRRAGARLDIGCVWKDVDRNFEKTIKRNGAKLSYCRICQEEKIIRKQIGLHKSEVIKSMYQTYYVIAYTDDGTHYDGKPKVVTSAELAEEQDKCKEATDGNWSVAILHTFSVKHYDAPRNPIDELRKYFEGNGMPIDEKEFAKMEKHLQKEVIECDFCKGTGKGGFNHVQQEFTECIKCFGSGYIEPLPAGTKVCKGLIKDKPCPLGHAAMNDSDYCDYCYETGVDWAEEEEAEQKMLEAEESHFEREAERNGQIYDPNEDIPF